MSAGELANRLLERGISLPKQSKLWGVTPLQLRNYRKGASETPRIDVAYNVLQNITLDGQLVVVLPYTSPESITEAYNMSIQDDSVPSSS